jgi:predicted transposase YdaD
MLGLSLQDSQIYQEVKQEGKAEMLAITVPLLLKTGMTIEQIAQQTGIDLEVIRQVTQRPTA